VGTDQPFDLIIRIGHDQPENRARPDTDPKAPQSAQRYLSIVILHRTITSALESERSQRLSPDAGQHEPEKQ
jgi:hypothetical protein